MRVRAIALLTIAGLGSGCAAHVHGSGQTLRLESEPPGATVTLSDGARCTTPCALPLPPDRDVVARILLAELAVRAEPPSRGPNYVPFPRLAANRPERPNGVVACGDGTYALVLTAASLGEDGRPVRCPRE